MKKSEEFPWDEAPSAGPPKYETPGFVVPGIPEMPRRTNPIFDLAKKIHCGDRSLTAEECDVLVSAVRNPGRYDWRTRRAAAWSLGQTDLGDRHKRAAASALTAAIEGIEHERIAPRLLIGAGISLPIAIIVFAALSSSAARMTPIGMLFALWLLFGALVLAPYLPISLAVDDRRNELVIAECVRSLSRLRLAESVPVILDALALAAGRRPGEAADAVLPLALEAITPEHYGKIPGLTSSLLGAFYKAGTESKHAILMALGRAGDGWAADRLVRNRSYQSIAVQAWMDDVLVILWERRKQELHAERLLRPAAVPDHDTLLRAATAGESAPEKLLRPASNE